MFRIREAEKGRFFGILIKLLYHGKASNAIRITGLKPLVTKSKRFMKKIPGKSPWLAEPDAAWYHKQKDKTRKYAL